MNTAENSTNREVSLTNHRRLSVATGAVLVLGSLGDFLFWQRPPGLSVGIFCLVLATCLILLGHRTSSVAFVAFLLVACCLQSAIELCFTNIASLAVLTIVLFGETTFGGLRGKWDRWSEALYAFISGPSRWRDFVTSWVEVVATVKRGKSLDCQSLGRAIVAVLPAAIIAMIFAGLLSAGNAILANSISKLAIQIKAWILEFSFGRTVMWLAWLTIGIAFFWPRISDSARWWTRRIPLWHRGDERLGRWQSALVLAAVNVLFFAANTIDVLYLWIAAELPEGVSYSSFVHQGVYSLIAAVLLAAGILALLFQQQPSIARGTILRGLAMIWIGQNFILILGVLRRLDLYVQAYQLSELRVYVACFLALVATGFLLLAREIWNGMNLGRLLFSNLVATFVLFFTLQFCDVGTWVANWNVSRWIKNEHPSIDLRYLISLGPKGWPGLLRVASSDRNPAISELVRSHLATVAAAEQSAVGNSDWRSFQVRRTSRLAAVIASQSTNP